MTQTLFDMNPITVEDISKPSTYKGIYSFHKYWGKKPTESIVYFIENFTFTSDIVLDPFLGSGLISRECLSRDRRFIGIDINPFAIEYAKFLLELPKPAELKMAIERIKAKIKQQIDETYLVDAGKIASHYLWNKDNLLKVWVKPEAGRTRIELEPTVFDIRRFRQFSTYSVKHIRMLKFFMNSRINSNKQMTIYDLFTRRALHNIDLLLAEFQSFPENIRRALLLILTASSGQMSSMVFAITNRGKTKNRIAEKIEVGSWVIGYWRPELHFEINVWNCFESRAMKLYKGLLTIDDLRYNRYDSIDALFKHNSGASIINGDCIDIMRTLPTKSIKLICTDPPHSDRIPYLELSEMWNAILGTTVSFDKEIIVSNAKERNKNKTDYIKNMKLFIVQSTRILTDDGMLLIYFNARDKQSWTFLDILKENLDLQFIGSFPMEYSASSVVQDNRKGGMKTDYVLVLRKSVFNSQISHELNKIPGWSVSMPNIKTNK